MAGETPKPGGDNKDAETSFELLERSRGGDAEALNRLLERYMPALRRWARGRLPTWARDVSDTQDLVQDTVIQAMKNLDTFRPQRVGALQAYLRQALMNKIRDELRRSARRPARTELPETMPATAASPLEQAIGREALEVYEAALMELRETDREAIIARVELGQSYEEVAAILGKPSAEAARLAVHRAMLRLAEKMKPNPPA
jgi:RNA polymerase sigma-70 factor (ECF subfamily)